jgi:dihydroneopterin aldolase
MKNQHMTKEKFDELEKLAKPLQDWMMDNFNMMCRIEITCDNTTVLSPEIGLPMTAKGL